MLSRNDAIAVCSILALCALLWPVKGATWKDYNINLADIGITIGLLLLVVVLASMPAVSAL